MKTKAKSQLKDGVQGEWRLLIMESKSKFVVNYHKLHFIHIVSRLDSKSPSKLHEKIHHPYFTKCANTLQEAINWQVEVWETYDKQDHLR